MPVTCAHLSVSSLPQHFVCLPLSVEIALLALSTSHSFVYLRLSIQRLQARSKYILVCSSDPSLARLYALYRKAELALLAPSSRLPAPSSQPSIFQTIIHPRLNPGT